MKGLQCEKALYLNRHEPQLKAEVSARQQAVFDRGTNIGLLARDLFPGGTDASPKERYAYAESVVFTKELMALGCAVIYEAAFMYEGVYAAVDILVRSEGRWKAYEVKQNSEIKKAHLPDAAVQYYVMTKSGVVLDDISIVHINNQYVRRGPLEVEKLFVAESVLEEVLEQQAFVEQQVPYLKSVLEQTEVPTKDIGPHCTDPYTCDFKAHCWKHLPSPSVFDIAKLNINRKTELYQAGIIRYEDITPEVGLNDRQRLQVTCHLENREHIDQEAVRGFVEGLAYPMYFMDFETFKPGVPLYDGTSPYQNIPFQFSLHYKKTPDADLRHVDFLADAGPDPRREFVEKLLHYTRLPGTILTYNQSFEQGILEDLADQLQEHAADLQERISRLRDLMTPFQNRWYYSPEMQGSYSIKAVLPAVVPTLSYDKLAIGDGEMASYVFQQMIEFPNKDYSELRKQMREYCKLDTLAMVRVMEVVRGIVN